MISHLENLDTYYLADILAELSKRLSPLANIPLEDIAPDDRAGYWRERARLAANIARVSAEITSREIRAQ